MSGPLDVDALIDDPDMRVVVCCGSGGVGKTTTAAALALRAAERGRDVVVLTIDPARRLAQSMGLTELDNTPRRVSGVDETVEHAIRVLAEQHAREQLAEIDLPVLELEDSTDGIDTAGLYELAEALVEQGVR